MEEITKYIYKTEDLKKCLELQESVIVYGIGDYGKRLVDSIIAMEKKDKIKAVVVTKKQEAVEDYRGIKIYEAASYFEKEQKSYVIIAISVQYQRDVQKLVNRYGMKYCYMTRLLYTELESLVDTRTIVEYRGIDFLLAGFCKCGTTSLYDVLHQKDGIYLSDEKESLFYSWRDMVTNPLEILKENFMNKIRAGQVVGMIEPTFATKAEQIYSDFGSDVKLIFLVGNPVNAFFSYFKMACRTGISQVKELYQENEHYRQEMLEEYFEKCKSNGTLINEYIYWIEKFWEYYPRENVKIIFFEELIKEPNRVINEVLDFIGVSAGAACESLPLLNEGSYVMADADGYMLANEMHELQFKKRILKSENIQEIHRLEHEIEQIKEEYNKAEKIYDIKLTEQQRKMLEEYFDDSVRKLEKELGKDLSKLWF